jgi:hypothetical protein
MDSEFPLLFLECFHYYRKATPPITRSVTLPPSYPVMASSQTCHLVNNDVPVSMETVIDGPYLNDQQILAEVMLVFQ